LDSRYLLTLSYSACLYHFPSIYPPTPLPPPLLIFFTNQPFLPFPTNTLQIPPSSGGSTWFTTRHIGGPSGTTLRLLYYPHVPPSPGYLPTIDIRAGAHSDYGSITLLFRLPGQPGLEILPPGSPDFVSVPISPPGTETDAGPPILVNIGDLLSYWTNNLFKSTVHRVVFPAGGREGGEDRYSIAYFGHPVGETVLEPVPSERVVAAGKEGGAQGNEAGREGLAMTANEHLMGRLKATYLGLYSNEEAG
jgi:isopenicillin N synthase-like dioxygenase